MNSRAWSSVAWLVAFLASVAAALALIDAPPIVAYQHYRLWPGDTGGRLALATIAATALLLATVGRHHVGAVVRWLRATASPIAIAAMLPVVVATSVAPSREPMSYLGEALFATVVQVICALALVAAVRDCPEPVAAAAARVGERVLGSPDVPGPDRPDRFALIVAAGVLAVAAVLAVTVYERHPHVPDEVVYLLQARYLADGMLTMPAPPVPAAFNIDLMHYEANRWFSPVPPGWPFVLAVGAWLGVPWLVNPVLAALAVVLASMFLGTLFDQRTTRVAVLLLATSPWFLFMAMNFMTHTFALVLALGAGVGVARARRSGRWLPAALAGLCVGGVSLIRPLEGLVVALLAGFWSLGARGRTFRLAPSAWLVVGTAITGALVLPYNRLLSGDPLRFPLMAYIDKYYEPGSNDMGFGPNRGLGWGGLDPFPGHGAVDVGVNALLNASQVNHELLGWAIGATLVLVLLPLVAWRRLSRSDGLMAVVIAAIVLSHSFYWFSGGPDFGARYWYLIIVPCVALAARSVLAVAADRPAGALTRQGRTLVGLAVLVGVTMTVYVPWRAVTKYRHYRGMRPDVRALAQRAELEGALVLVRGRRHPDYASAAIYNPIDLRAPGPIFAWDASPAIRAQVVAAYEGRPVWIVDGPSITGEGYRLVAGPFEGDAVLTSDIPPSAAGDEAHIRDPVFPDAASRP